MDNNNSEIQKLVDELAEKAKHLYINELKEQGIPASNDLINTLTAEGVIDGTHIIIYFNLNEYWRFVEQGTGEKAGHKKYSKMIPVDIIKDWIDIKPVPIPADFNKLKDPKSSFAYAIAHRISFGGPNGRLSGTEPKHPLQNMNESKELAKIKDEIVGKITEILHQQAIEEYLDKL